ncbi:MAG TPA: SURF1 family protein [Micromonosporaceae bacterium]
MYRFLLTARWLGYAALTLVLAAIMVGLGFWQLARYHQHSAVNARVAAAAAAQPVPLTSVLKIGSPPAKDQAWTKVSVSGRYDPAHEVLARGRTVNDSVGFEVVTPLVLADGSAVLVDRGWIPPAPGGAFARPDVPPAPTGQVTVVGRVHLPESRPDKPSRADGRTEVRRISATTLAATMPYRLYGGYVVMDRQQPPADPAFVAIPSDHENAWQNAGYVVQWWMFAALTLVGFGWAARREAQGPPADETAPTSPAVTSTG